MKLIVGPGVPGQNGGVVPPSPENSPRQLPARPPSGDSADDDDIAHYKGVPVHLYGSAVLQPNASAAINAVALKNPNAGPMLINEIKFMISGQSAAQVFSGGGIRCRLDMGNIQLTNGFIPLWLFGRVENLDAELNRSLYFKWRLPKPLFIPAGGVVVPTLQHSGIPASSATVSVAYGGRAFGSNFNPKKVYLPYIAGYTTKIFDFDEATTDTSTETDLANTFDTPLVIDRITGRINNITYGDSQDDYVASGYPIAHEMVTARMWDSLGNSIVRSYTPLYTICHGVMRCWNMDGKIQIPPGAYYIVDFKKVAPGAGALNLGYRLQAGVAINAWREVAR